MSEDDNDNGEGMASISALDDILFNMRMIFLSGVIGEDIYADDIIKKLFVLDAMSDDKITMFINSRGGSIDEGMAIYDSMMYINSPVRTISTGLCASMAALLLSSGAKGERYSYPNARLMIHQPHHYNHEGDTKNIEILANESKKVKKKMVEIFAVNTGKPMKEIEQDIDRDYYMSPGQAKKYGLIDKIINGEKFSNYKKDKKSLLYLKKQFGE